MSNTQTGLESANIADALAVYGINYADAMDRMLNNGALYQQLAQHYTSDQNYLSLIEDMKAGDYETAYKHAHTLKGVAGNLSFTQLHQLAAQICEALVDNDIDTAQSLLGDLSVAHDRVHEGLAFWAGLSA